MFLTISLTIVDTRLASFDTPQQEEVIAGQTARCLLCSFGCVFECSGTDISHTKLLFSKCNRISPTNNLVCMLTEPKASYQTIQYEYA